MSPPISAPARRVAGFPRVSGDEPFAEVKALADKWFSPRERG